MACMCMHCSGGTWAEFGFWVNAHIRNKWLFYLFAFIRCEEKSSLAGTSICPRSPQSPNYETPEFGMRSLVATMSHTCDGKIWHDDNSVGTQDAANCLYVRQMQCERCMNFEWFEWLRVLLDVVGGQQFVLCMTNLSVWQIDLVHAVYISWKIHLTPRKPSF